MLLIKDNYFHFYCGVLLSLLPFAIILGPSVSTSIILILIISSLAYFIIHQHWSWFNNRDIKILFVVFIYLIINTLLAQDPSLSVNRNVGFIRYILLAAILVYFFKSKNYSYVFLIWSIIIFIVCLDSVYEIINKENILGYEQTYGRRLVSFFKDEPVVGTYLSSFIFIICGFFHQIETKSLLLKILMIILISFIFGIIILSGERAVTIKSIIGLIIFAFLVGQTKFYKKMIFVIFFIFAIFTVINSSNFLKLRYYGQTLGYGGTLKPIPYIMNTDYIKLSKAGINVFKDYPIFGVGNKNFGKVCFQKLKKNPTSGTCSTHPHQIYIELLAEHGLIGTIILLSSIFFILFKNFKNYLIYKNSIHLGSLIFIICSFIPLIPSGSFFSNFNSTFFWINFSIMIAFQKMEFKSNKINLKFT